MAEKKYWSKEVTGNSSTHGQAKACSTGYRRPRSNMVLVVIKTLAKIAV